MAAVSEGLGGLFVGGSGPKVEKPAHYIAKYVVSPPMVLSQLVSHGPETGQVKYWYCDHRTGRKEVIEVTREQFISHMVQTILPNLARSPDAMADLSD